MSLICGSGTRRGRNEKSLKEPLSTLIGLKRQGLIRHIGLSNVSPRQLKQAQTMTEIVCVQNHYNLVHRKDDAFIDALAAQKIAYVPYFPLGGFRPLASAILDEVAASLDATPRQVTLAWLLHRAPNILVIAGTSSLDHLQENLQAGTVTLTPEILVTLDSIAAVAAN